MYFKVTVQLTAVTLTRCYAYDRWNISVLKRDLKVVRDGDIRVPCDMLFQAEMRTTSQGGIVYTRDG